MAGPVDLRAQQQVRQMQVMQAKERLFGLAAAIYEKNVVSDTTPTYRKKFARECIDASVDFWETVAVFEQEKTEEARNANRASSIVPG